jgi:hypothetical protein
MATYISDPDQRYGLLHRLFGNLSPSLTFTGLSPISLIPWQSDSRSLPPAGSQE